MLSEFHDLGVDQTLRLRFFELHVVVPNICLHVNALSGVADDFAVPPLARASITYLVLVARVVLLPHDRLHHTIEASQQLKPDAGEQHMKTKMGTTAHTESWVR